MSRELKVFVWHDKVEDIFLKNFAVDESERAVCRGFLQAFDGNYKLRYIPGLVDRDFMNINEYELCCIGEYDDNTGLLVPYDKPRVVDVTQVVSKPRDTHGEVLPD